MAITNLNNAELEAEKKHQRRGLKNKPKMKISGQGVKKLQKLIAGNKDK